MDAVDLFADEVESFANWAARGSDTGAEAARNGLIHLTGLYLAALKLPTSDSNGEVNPDLRVTDDEWNSIRQHASRLPLDYYSEVFNPLPVPSEAPTTASLSDDIADFYRDVVTGLNYSRAGQRQEAIWHWTFNFDYHWGEHITGATRALQSWLSKNSPRY